MTLKIVKEFPNSYNMNISPKEKEGVLAEICSISEKIILDYFSEINPAFRPTFEVNNRLSSCYGRFIVNSNTIQLSGRLCKAALLVERNQGVPLLEKVLKHELAHWFLFMKKQPFDDGNEVFEKLLVEIGSFSSGATRAKLAYAPTLPNFGFKHSATCEKCGHISFANNRYNGKYSHGDGCGGFLSDEKIVFLTEND